MANGSDTATADIDRALNRLEQAVEAIMLRIGAKDEALDEAGRRIDLAMAEIKSALSADQE